MVRFQIVLNSEEADALNKWANSEYRDPREQVRFVLRRELIRLGWIPSEDKSQPQLTSDNNQTFSNNAKKR